MDFLGEEGWVSQRTVDCMSREGSGLCVAG